MKETIQLSEENQVQQHSADYSPLCSALILNTPPQPCSPAGFPQQHPALRFPDKDSATQTLATAAAPLANTDSNNFLFRGKKNDSPTHRLW